VVKPNQPTNSLLQLSPEDLKKITKAREKAEGTRNAIDVDPETYFIAEFGFYFGFEGMMAIINNEIDLELASALLAGAHKVWYANLSDLGYVQFMAAHSAASTKPSENFKKAMKVFHKAAEVSS
jgi:hypothetical protein